MESLRSPHSWALAVIRETDIEAIGRNRFLLVSITVIYIYGLINGVFFSGFSKSNIIGFWAQDFAYFVVTPIVFLYYVFKRFGLRPKDYGLIKGSPAYPTAELIGASFFIAFFLGLVIIPIDYISYYFFLNHGFTSSEFSYKDVVPNGFLKLPVVFYLAITAGLMEEIVYRGIPYRLVSESESIKHKKFIYILVTSVTFSTIHWTSGLHFLIPTFIFGLIAAMLYLNLKNLWPLVGAHFLYDFYIFW